MNKTLALFFSKQYIIAGIKPYLDKFLILSKSGNNKFYLYFLIDKSNDRIDYSEIYNTDKRAGVVTDFFEKIEQKNSTYSLHGYDWNYIELLSPILDDIKDVYYQKMSDFDDESQSDIKKQPIPANICFTDNISQKARQQIRNYLEETDIDVLNTDFTLAESLVRAQMYKEPNIGIKDKFFAIAECLGNNLNISIVLTKNIDDFERKEAKTFRNYGADPRVGVVAKLVVNKANSINVLHSESEMENEYSRHLKKAENWINELDKTIRPFILVETALKPAPENIQSITLDKKEIERLTTAHISQMARFFKDTVKSAGININRLEKIILIGNTMNNRLVLEEFQRFGEHKIITLSENNVFDVLRGMLFEDEEIVEIQELEYIRTSDLKPGVTIEFSWSGGSNRPERIVKAVYNGNESFTIISHENSSIKTGDSFKTEALKKDYPAELKNVYRPSENKILGNYNSGNGIIYLKILE